MSNSDEASLRVTFKVGTRVRRQLLLGRWARHTQKALKKLRRLGLLSQTWQVRRVSESRRTWSPRTRARNQETKIRGQSTIVSLSVRDTRSASAARLRHDMSYFRQLRNVMVKRGSVRSASYCGCNLSISTTFPGTWSGSGSDEKCSSSRGARRSSFRSTSSWRSWRCCAHSRRAVFRWVSILHVRRLKLERLMTQKLEVIHVSCNCRRHDWALWWKMFFRKGLTDMQTTSMTVAESGKVSLVP